MGLGHLGTVVASCVSRHYQVTVYEPRYDKTIHPYQSNNDPGIIDAWSKGTASGSIKQVFSALEAKEADVIWCAIDTPIVECLPDTKSVLKDLEGVLVNAEPNTVVIVSSQLTAGSMRQLSDRFPSLSFVCQPENLRIGRGLSDFLYPDRIVIGSNDSVNRPLLQELFGHFSDKLLFMSVESAEWVKHAINAYLSMTIAFANEFGWHARENGANLRDIERAMKSDLRIGPRAYLAYGDGPGEHLSRDVNHLASIAGGLFSDIADAHERFESSGNRIIKQPIKQVGD